MVLKRIISTNNLTRIIEDGAEVFGFCTIFFLTS